MKIAWKLDGILGGVFSASNANIMQLIILDAIPMYYNSPITMIIAIMNNKIAPMQMHKKPPPPSPPTPLSPPPPTPQQQQQTQQNQSQTQPITAQPARKNYPKMKM